MMWDDFLFRIGSSIAVVGITIMTCGLVLGLWSAKP